MPFGTFESSIEQSQPAEVIRFTLGAESFFYTPSEDTISIGAEDYVPTPIKRGKISQSPEDRDNVLEFTVDGDNEFARRYIGVVPGSRALVTVRRVQRPDFPGPEVITLFEGYVSSVKFEQDGHVAKIAVQSIAAATSRPIPRFTYQGLCNHVLYDDGCKVDPTDTTFRHTGTVSNVVDNTITVIGADGFPDGYFTGGFVEADGGNDARLILNHVGNVLQLLLPFPFSTLGAVVVVLAGCDHTIATCDQKFFTTEDPTSNVINYGGFAFIPTKDIFATGLD
jgi:uncharacterized phage protein (TIGR02218 family)